MEPGGKPGMQGVFGVMLVIGGLILVVMILSDLANWNPFGNFLNLGEQTVTGQTGITSTGAGYYVTKATDTSKSVGQQQSLCRQGGGVWFNGTCRHFTGAGANK